MAQWNAEPAGDVDENGADGFPQVHVLMGIKMAGITTHQASKKVQLSGDFRFDGRYILQGDDAVHGHPFPRAKGFFPQIDVKPEAEAWMVSGVGRRFGGRRPAYHQAGAGDDPTAVGLDNAAIDTRALAEIIRIDDQVLGGYS